MSERSRHDGDISSATARTSTMQWGMYACCAVMLLPVAGFFVGSGTPSTLADNAAVFAPFLLCGGMHVVMPKVMGRSCHVGQDETAKTADDETSTDARPGSSVA